MRDSSVADLELDRTVLLHGGSPEMKPTRRIVTFATTAVVALTLLAGPAAAKSPKGTFDYYAEIDCGAGVMKVGSGVDLWSTLVDLDSGKKFEAGRVARVRRGLRRRREQEGRAEEERRRLQLLDGVATGTVTSRRRRRGARPSRRGRAAGAAQAGATAAAPPPAPSSAPARTSPGCGSDRDPGDGEHGRHHERERPRPAVAQQQRDGDREGGGGVVARGNDESCGRG